MSAVSSRRKGFKKGIDAEDARRKRETNIIELRKNKRDENLQKKRAVGLAGPGATAMEESNRGGAASPAEGEEESCGRQGSILLCGLGDPAGLIVAPVRMQLENLPLMVRGVYSDDAQQQLEATTQFRKLLSIGKLTHRIPAWIDSVNGRRRLTCTGS